MWRMKLRWTAFLAAAMAGAFVLVAACGGGGDGGSGNSGNGSPGSSGDAGGGSGSGGSGSGGSGTTCQPQTVVGGDLFVVEQGPVGVTLQSNSVTTAYTFNFLYDNVFGIPTNNRQDKWGQVAPPPFPPGTPVGTSIQVQLQPFPFVNGEQTPATFPKGIPIELWFFLNNTDPPGPAKSSSTASINKDMLGHDQWHTASVTYGANSTATVTFFLGGVPSFAVSLTNVSGKDAPAGC